MIARLRTVDAIVSGIGASEGVLRSQLQRGDRLLVVTENSIYSIRVLGGGWFAISGGWFDRQGLSPARTSIAGCTWGGSAIRRDVVAARGLRLEFGNRVVTTRIREFRILRDKETAAAEGGFVPVSLAALFSACYGAGSHRG